jgi:hypothetical protein
MGCTGGLSVSPEDVVPYLVAVVPEWATALDAFAMTALPELSATWPAPASPSPLRARG